VNSPSHKIATASEDTHEITTSTLRPEGLIRGPKFIGLPCTECVAYEVKKGIIQARPTCQLQQAVRAVGFVEFTGGRYAKRE
jgi:hypothetical protein